MSRKIYLCFCLLHFILLQGVGQQFIGVNNSNYAGIHAVLQNPAHAADTPYKIYINLGALGVTSVNNSMRWAAPYSLFGLFTGTVPSKYNGPMGKPLWLAEYYRFKTSELLDLRLNTEIRGPSFQLSFPRKRFGLAGGVRFRIFGSLVDASPGLAAAVFTGTNNPGIKNLNFAGEKGHMNIGGYNEIFGSISVVLKENHRHFYKVGGTLKRLTSGSQLAVFGDDLNYRIFDTSPGSRRQNIEVTKATGTFFHAADPGVSTGIGGILGQMTSVQSVGNGFGADIGFVYEHRPDFARQRYYYKGQVIPDPELVKYKYRFGVSLTDIGFVQFASATDVQVGGLSEQTAFIPPATFYRIGSTSEFVSDMESVFDFDQANYGRSFNVLMPAKLNVQGDYKVREGFYLSGVLRQYLLGRDRIGPIGYSGLSIIPRFEKKYLEYSFPVSLDYNYRVLAIGASLRAGPLSIGSDNLTGLLGIGNPRGAAIHAGLSWGFDHKRPQNKLIQCP